MKYQNPIIRGFHPDPSICRVGSDFYLVTSTFTYFPGIPLYHSKDLVHWDLVGHCLTRESQIYLEACKNSKGIYAPTIRWHQGRFYVITTEVTGKGNFIVHSEHPEGPWSEPVLIDQNGIDPSLFWDDDGSCWYCGKGRLDGKRGIVAFQVNPLTGELLSERYLISRGCGGKCAEGPHIYKKDGWYYLVTAEGGTQYSHRVVIQRSKCITGGYEPCPHNPLLSHMEKNWKVIQAVGHGDLVEDTKGNWWCVCLGIRMFGDILLHNLGRETFLAPVTWKDGWPQVEEASLSMEMEGELPKTGEMVYSENEGCWSFLYSENEEAFPEELSYIKGKHSENYRIKDGKLFLYGTETGLDSEMGSPSCILREQQEFKTEAVACLNLSESRCSRFGMTVYYSNYNHYDVAAVQRDGGWSLSLYKHIYDVGYESQSKHVEDAVERIWMKIQSDKTEYRFFYSTDGEAWNILGSGTIAAMCTETMMERSYTGTMIGLFSEQGAGVFEQEFTINSTWDGADLVGGIVK